MSEDTAGARPRAGVGLRSGLIACAIAAALAALAPSLGGELVYDDLSLVARNPALAGWKGLSEHLFRPHWDFAEAEGQSMAGYWRPLAVLVLFAGKALGGPVAHHALSLAIHALAILVAFLLAERLTRDRLVAFATALLFGLHPVHVESVAWISATNDPLSGMFVLASLLAFVRWRDAGSRGAPIAAPALLLAGLLSKESALAWFLLAPALDLVRTGGARPRPVLRAYATALAAGVVYWAARAAVFGEATAGLLRVGGRLEQPALREATVRAELLGGALRLLAWPAKLNLFRELRPEIPSDDPELLLALLALVAGIVVAAVAWRKRLYVLLAGLVVIPAALAPLIVRFEAAGRFPLSDRFLYVASFGFALFVAALLIRNLPRAAAVAAIAAVAAAFGARSFARTGFWKDEVTLFTSAAEASPRSVYVSWGLGRVLIDEYQRHPDPATLLQARDAFERAQDLVLEHDPSILSTWFDELQSSLGLGWFQLLCALDLPQECTLDEAEGLFRAIAAKAPWRPEPHCGLGVTLRHMGRLEEADAALRKGVEANPRYYEAWYNLAQLSLARQDWSGALEQLDQCLELAPDEPQLWTQLGMAAIELDLPDRARAALGRARALAPDSAEPLVQLGVMAAREQRFDVALDFFEQALRIDGAHGPAHLLRAKTLVRLSRPLEAINAFLDASRWLQEPSKDPLRPQQTFEAFYDAGMLTLQIGKTEEALTMLEEAARRDPDGRWVPGLRDEIARVRAELDEPK